MSYSSNLIEGCLEIEAEAAWAGGGCLIPPFAEGGISVLSSLTVGLGFRGLNWNWGGRIKALVSGGRGLLVINRSGH